MMQQCGASPGGGDDSYPKVFDPSPNKYMLSSPNKNLFPFPKTRPTYPRDSALDSRHMLPPFKLLYFLTSSMLYYAISNLLQFACEIEVIRALENC